MNAKEQIDAVREFARWWSRGFGRLHGGLPTLDLPPTDALLLDSVGRHDGRTAAELAADLRLDGAHVSRALRRLSRSGLVRRAPAPEDRRRRRLALTEAGRRVWTALDGATAARAAVLLDPLSAGDRRELAGALSTARRLLGGAEASAPVILRDPGPGDLGWVVQRHGAYYAEAFGWDRSFEGAAAEIIAEFVRRDDRRRERCWIAERDGRNVGCVFAMRKSDTVAQLRCLLVEPAARGTGLGTRLVQECVRFARTAGYGRMYLWTAGVLGPARRIYAREGFRCVASALEPHFGDEIESEHWELEL